MVGLLLEKRNVVWVYRTNTLMDGDALVPSVIVLRKVLFLVKRCGMSRFLLIFAT